MTHFQVPDDRVLNDAAAPIFSGDPPSLLRGNWPDTPEGYRLFVTGNSGDERIGIHTGQRIDLQLTGGIGCRIETMQDQWNKVQANATGEYVVRLANRNPSPVVVSDPVASSDKHKFKLSAKQPGGTILYAMDGANNQKASLAVVVGNFEYHDHAQMKKDLIAETCRGSDSLKILALQRMLRDRFVSEHPITHKITTINPDDIFSQNSDLNWHPQFGFLACGVVAKWRGAEIFDDSAKVDYDWYTQALHERLPPGL